MTKDQALKHALEKFEYMNHIDSIFHGEFDFQINAIKKALAQQAEPVAWVNLNALSEQINSVNCGTVYRLPSEAEGRQPLYTSPPPRQPLTDEEIDELLPEIVSGGTFTVITYGRAVARAIEAAVWEKNT